MNDTNGNGNGDGNGKVYVRFGPKDTQEMQLETAEQVLSLWRERKPKDFGAYLAEVVTGVSPKGR